MEGALEADAREAPEEADGAVAVHLARTERAHDRHVVCGCLPVAERALDGFRLALEPFVGIQHEDPLGTCCSEGEVTRGGKVVLPGSSEEASAEGAGDLRRAILGTRVDDHRLIGDSLQGGKGCREMLLLVPNHHRQGEPQRRPPPRPCYGWEATLVPAATWRMALRRSYPLFVAANLVGVVYGVFWYGEALFRRPPWTWFFVPDCPWAALLSATAFLVWGRGREQPLLFGLAKGTSVFFGVWTLAVLAITRTAEPRLLLSHGLLLGEGLLVWRFWPLGRRETLFLLGLLLLNLLADYVFGLHPPLPLGTLPLVRDFSLAWYAVFAILTGVDLRRTRLAIS
jgi:uncharacterized membrane protein YpjA